MKAHCQPARPLIRNYVELSYGQLFQGLRYEQYAPPLFSVVVKACLTVFGTNELAARLFPLVCSMATLGLFRRLARRWLPPSFACLALAFVAFGYIFIDYATECKQYATDGFVALGLLEVAHWAAPRRLTPRLALGLAGLGMAAVWLSMPAVFILAGSGCWLLLRSFRARDYGQLGRWLAVEASWAASFLVYFFLLLQPSTHLGNLQNFHHDFYLAFPPLSSEALALLGKQLDLLANRAIGKTVLAVILAAIGFTVGSWQLARRRQEPFWFFLVPIIGCLAASALHYYSVIPRLVLFFLPLVVLIVFLGLAALSTRQASRLVLLAIMVVVLGNQQQLRSLVKPFYGEYGEVREGLEFIAQQQQPGEVAFMNHNVIAIAYYYLALHEPRIQLQSVVLQRPYASSGDIMHEGIVQLQQRGTRRVWLLYDRDDDSLRAFAATQGRILKQHHFQRGYVLLLEFGQLPTAPAG